jgi:hypothetical protein
MDNNIEFEERVAIKIYDAGKTEQEAIAEARAEEDKEKGQG